MQRVEAAIREGRCVLAFGGKVLSNPEVLMELRRRNVPSIVLGTDIPSPAVALSADVLAPVTQGQGVLVLVEPDTGSDGKALADLAQALEKAKNKPKLYVAARAFNPFAMPMSLRLLKVEHLKLRAKDFLGALPVEAPVAPVSAAAAEDPKKDKGQAPKAAFLGREEELQQLVEMLKTPGGPIVVHGPPGVGKRWLVEKAIADAGLKRVPELALGRGVAADTFIGRLALMAEALDHKELVQALQRPERPGPYEQVELALKALGMPGWENHVWVVTDLETLLDRRNDAFYRSGRLEILLDAILRATPTLRIVFLSTRKPAFYREGAAANLRTLELQGFKGRELHLLFEAWHCPEFPREHFGPLSDRTHGHPMASRAIALQIREGAPVEEILEAPRMFKAESVADTESLSRHLKRRIQGLPEGTRKALGIAAHLLVPMPADALQALGIPRAQRLELLALGLLDQTPLADDRRYYVHPLVREHLSYQEVADFDTLEKLGNHLLDVGRKAPPMDKQARGQEANRLFVEARRPRNRVTLAVPDLDTVLEEVRGILRRKNARVDIARMRVNEVMKSDWQNPEIHLVDVEVLDAEKAGADKIAEAYARAESHPVPEVFHHKANFFLDKNSRGKAAAALEQGVAMFPNDGRLWRRLGGLYLRQNKIDDAINALKKAMELEPMMPDTYGLLGEALTDLGAPRWAEASDALEEARRLDPTNAGHMVRLANLLRGRGILDAEARDGLWQQAEELLRQALVVDPDHSGALVLITKVLLDKNGDLDAIDWFAKKAAKGSRSHDANVQLARVHIRRNELNEAERLVELAIKKEPSNHEAFAAKGELWSAQGQVFLAFDAYKHARERSPKDAPERTIYEAQMTQLGALIESGAAATALAQLPTDEAPDAAPSGDDGPRRDPGTTTIRRKGKRRGGQGEQDAAPADAGGSAPETLSPPAELSAPETTLAEGGAESATGNAGSSTGNTEPEASEPTAGEPN